MDNYKVIEAVEQLRQAEAEEAGRLQKSSINFFSGKGFDLNHDYISKSAKKKQDSANLSNNALIKMAGLLRENQKYPKCPCVYLLKQVDMHKIGYAGNLKKRLSTICTSTPYQVSVVLAVLCKSISSASLIEKNLHEYYANKRVKGEWFDLNEFDIAVIGKEFENTVVFYK